MSFGDAEAETLLDILSLSLGYRPTGRLPHITRAVLAFAKEQDASAASLLAKRHPAFISCAIAAATVGHTLFFRHHEHFDRLRKELNSRRRNAPVRIWSAGCSTGEEPVSIALTSRDVDVETSVLATDINRGALDRAQRGRFTNPLPPEISEGDLPSVLASIDFRVVPLPWPSESDSWETFDIIFCRNVLIYFSPEDATAILEAIAERLAPQGLLVVSPVEALLPMPANFRTSEPLGWLEPIQRIDRAHRPVSSKPPRAKMLSSAAPHPLHSLLPRGPSHGGDPLGEAAMYFGLGALDDAERVLRGLLDDDPSNPKAWFLLGEALSRRGELVQARLAFHAAARTGHEKHADDAIVQAARRRARVPVDPEAI